MQLEAFTMPIGPTAFAKWVNWLHDGWPGIRPTGRTGVTGGRIARYNVLKVYTTEIHEERNAVCFHFE